MSEDLHDAAVILLSYLAGQPLLTWPVELLVRYASADPPHSAELWAVLEPLERAITRAPADLAADLDVIVCPLRTIAAFQAGTGATLDVALDRDQLVLALTRVYQRCVARGYRFPTHADVPDTIADV